MRGRRFARFARWLVPLAVFALGGEAVVRWFHVVDRMMGFTRRLYMAVDDPYLTYVMRPNMDMTLRGVRVRTNEHGLRGPSTTLEPQPGVRRVLAVGDSATFGEAVAVEDAWPAVLQGELERRTGARWEVLNAGVQGWNAEGQLAYLEQRGLAFQPEIVVIGYNLNDFDYMPAIGAHGVLTRDPNQLRSAPTLAEWSEFYMLIRWFFQKGVPAWKQPAAPPLRPGEFHPLDRYESNFRKQYYRAPTDNRWPALVHTIFGFGRIAARGQPRVLLVILPDGDQFENDEPDLLPQKKILELCGAAGLDCLDAHAAFRAAGGRRLFMDIMHPNAEGYRVVARLVAERLTSGASASPAVGERTAR